MLEHMVESGNDKICEKHIKVEKSSKPWIEILFQDAVLSRQNSPQNLWEVIEREQYERVQYLIQNGKFDRIKEILNHISPGDIIELETFLNREDFESIKNLIAQAQYERIKRFLDGSTGSSTQSNDQIKLRQYRKLQSLFEGILDPFDLISETFYHQTYINKEEKIVPLALELFVDKEKWYDNRVNLKLFENISQWYDLRELGKRVVEKEVGSIIATIIKVKGIKWFLEKARNVNQQFNRTKEVVLKYECDLSSDEIGKIRQKLKLQKNSSFVLCELQYLEGMDSENKVMELINEYNYGAYEAFFKFAGLRVPRIVSWKSKLKDDTKAVIPNANSYSCVGVWESSSIREFWNDIGRRIVSFASNFFPDVKNEFEEARKAPDLIVRIEAERDSAYREIKGLVDSQVAREQHSMYTALRSFLAPPVAKAIIEKKEVLGRTEATILKVDIVKSTRITWDLLPEEIERFYMRVIDNCKPCIARYLGSLHQYLGDGSISEFGISSRTDYHTILGVLCGLELQRIQEYNKQHHAFDIGLRIAVSSGILNYSISRTREARLWNIAGKDLAIVARLEPKCPEGSVAVTEKVYRRIKRFFDINEGLNEKGQEYQGAIERKEHEREEIRYVTIKGLKKVTSCPERFSDTQNIILFEDTVDSIYHALQNDLRYPNETPSILEIQLILGEPVQDQDIVADLELERRYSEYLDNRCADFLAINAQEGDPLSAKTVALISYSVAQSLGQDPEMLAKMSFLYDVGKKHIWKELAHQHDFKSVDERSFDPKVRYDAEQRSEMLREIKMRSLGFLQTTGMHNLIPFVQDFYGSRETIEAQILKAAQIYVGIKVPKAHKQQSQDKRSEEEKQQLIVSALYREQIPERVITAMYDLKLFRFG